MSSDEIDPAKAAREAAQPFFSGSLIATMFQAKIATDISLEVIPAETEGKAGPSEVIRAHRLVLASLSPVFEAMLFPSSAIGTHSLNTNAVIPIRGYNPGTIRTILDALYTDNAGLLSLNDLQTATRFARAYCIPKLTAFASHLCTAGMAPHTALRIYEESPTLFGEHVGRQYVLENATAVLDSDGLVSAQKETLLSLAKDSKLAIDELALFKALHAWAKANSKSDAELQAHMRDFVPTVRFGFLSLEEMGLIARLNAIPVDLAVKLFAIPATSDDAERKAMSESLGFCTEARESALQFQTDILKSIDLKRKFSSLFSPDRKFPRGVKLTRLFSKKSSPNKTAQGFHSACDRKGPIMIVLTSGKHIWGGYIGANLESNNQYLHCKAWMWSISNPKGQVYKLLPNTMQNTIYCGNNYGPTFSSNHDMYIQPNLSNGSFSPNMYSNPAPGYARGSLSDFLPSTSFTVDEMEVFKVEWAPGSKSKDD